MNFERYTRLKKLVTPALIGQGCALPTELKIAVNKKYREMTNCSFIFGEFGAVHETKKQLMTPALIGQGRALPTELKIAINNKYRDITNCSFIFGEFKTRNSK
ncbi:hypothetical protein CXF72_02170 [Psychromonas sp. MB-3u-54]|nr:hypothetical protein CXF72_02170 [Psychromonas sp. MB-3u-54]